MNADKGEEQRIKLSSANRSSDGASIEFYPRLSAFICGFNCFTG
jgi:hypothetical protein